jgi:hypothetical protein
MGTDRKNAMLARPVPGLTAFLQAHFQASLKIVLQKLRSIRFAKHQHWPGPLAEVEGLNSDQFWSSRADRGAIGVMGFRNPVQA